MAVQSPAQWNRVPPARKREYITLKSHGARRIPRPGRSAFSKSVISAIAETYRVKADYDTAKRKRADNVDALAGVLLKTRAAERTAERALREHIEHHGCKI